jgi:uncharacterized protein YhaN
MTLTLAISVISALASLTAIATFLGKRRRAAMEEGKRQQIVEQLRCDLDHAQADLRDLERRLSGASGDMRELKSDVKHILEAIESMASKLDRHIEAKP